MAETLGTAAAVLQVAEGAVKASTELYEMILTIKNAPREITSLSSDIQALDRLLRNLEHSLQSSDTRRIVDQDEEVRKPMEGLKDLIKSCNCTCLEVVDRMRPYAQVGKFEDGSAAENNERLVSIRWFFKRRSILALVSDLQRTKFLFSDSMGSISLCVFYNLPLHLYKGFILTTGSILMLKIAAIRSNTSDEPALPATREFDDDAGSAVLRWVAALDSEQSTKSDMVSIAPSTLIQPAATKDADPHLTEELLGAVRRGTIPVVKLLLECVNVNARDPRYGRTALSVAAEIGNVSMARLLLENGAFPNTRQYSRSCWDDDWGPNWIAGRTPLGWAAVAGQNDIVELLLQYGANPNSATSAGRSALLDACWQDDRRSVRLLLEHGADVNFQSFHHGWRPIHEAARSNTVELAELLLEYNPLLDVNVEFNGHRRSPLHWAVTWCSTDMMKLLLSNGADTENGMFENNTPLHLAAANGWLDGINLLLASGASIDSMDAFLGETPLHKAARNLHNQACELLCLNGADTERRNIDGQDYQDILACARRYPCDWRVGPHQVYFITT